MPDWQWTMAGVEPTHGTITRGAEESGTFDAECAGEVFDYLVHYGPWDSFDQGAEVTISVAPPRKESDG